MAKSLNIEVNGKNLNANSDEFVSRGHMACPGCMAALSMRHLLKISGEKTIVVIPASCWSIVSGTFPTTALSVPLIHVPFATSAAVASGIKRALIAKNKDDINVIAWAGDGGTFDIGLQALSGAAERKEDILYICYDNEAYMNTGIQQSSATPIGAWTTTSPAGKDIKDEKKDIISIILAHKPAYVATATISYPDDFYMKIKKALDKNGFRFIHLLCACPPGWKIDSQDTVKVCRLAVDTDFFPLVEMGENYRLCRTVEPKNIEIDEYLKAQKRFNNINETSKKGIRDYIKLRNEIYGI
ncbi:MAG: thiamine pyrophosphate-dependent enzyme [Deferribacterota bacterium]|nr:thiamine pyrophosphate-dependent enzyme [Deferribacterota bacterium]